MTTMLEPRPRLDLELTIGVDSIEVIQADRRELIKEVAPLRARYGPGGSWDARRKALRSARANVLAGQLSQERAKAPSEAELERLAAGDAQTLAELADAESEMAQYYLLEDRIQELTELINRDQALIRYVTSEPKV